jgi:cytochrome c biogenesis protein
MIKKIWAFLGSIPLVIVLLIVLAIVSLVGIIVPQGMPEQDFAARFGALRTHIVFGLGINRIYSSGLFTALLAILSLSVLACTSSRIFRTLRESMHHRFLAGPLDMERFHSRVSFSAPVPAEGVPGRLRPLLARRLYFCSTQSKDGTTQISALSGMPREIGSLLFHLGIIVLLASGIVSRMGGFSYMQELHVGETAPVQDKSFSVRCNAFSVETNEEGAVKAYKSDLSIVDSAGKLLAGRSIGVNHPFGYEGVRFYQSSYGEQGDAIGRCTLMVTGPGLSAEGVVQSFPFDSTVPLVGDSIRLKVVRFEPDFIMEMGKGITSRSQKPNNQAVQIAITRRDGDTLASQWLFLRFPEAHEGSGLYKARFLSYEPLLYTGIQVVMNPGVGVVWVGIIAMTIGIFMIFFVARRRLWIYAEPEGSGKSRITIGGASGLPPDLYQAEFKKLGAVLERALHEGKRNP